ncbi:MAG: hypothetical protein ACFFCQ_16680 [Promethearchaeota archaeon]
MISKRALKQNDRKTLENILDSNCQLFEPDFTARISLRDAVVQEINTSGSAVSTISVEYPIKNEERNVFLRITIFLQPETDKKILVLLIGLFFPGKTTLSYLI